MTRLFVVAAWRNFLRHKLQTLINIASLAIGLTVFGFAFLYTKHELSFDRAWPDGERVHRLVLEQRGLPGMPDGFSNSVVGRAWDPIKNYFAEYTERATRVSNWYVRFKDAEGLPDNFGAQLAFVDPDFQDIFQVEVVDGDIGRVLGGPGFIALEETLAETLGYKDGAGGRITLTSSTSSRNGVENNELEYEVGAIYRLPRPISQTTRISMFTLVHEYSYPLLGGARNYAGWENGSQVWLKLKDGVDTAEFNALQPAFIQQEVVAYNQTLGPERKISEHLFYNWQPLVEIHFNPMPSENQGGRGGDPMRVWTFAIVGLLVLLVGCSNSVSLSLAAALERRREIGIRKAGGALQRDIMQQQLGEAVLLALLALIPAIALLELLLEPFQTLLPFAAGIEVGPAEYGLMVLIAGVVGFGSGYYPALVLSRTRPQQVLKAGAQENTKGSFGLRNMLVALQFCFASMLLIGTSALYTQLAVTRAQPLGFDLSNTVFVVTNSQSGASGTVLREEFQKIPGVTWALPTLNPPATDMSTMFNASPLVRSRTDTNEVKAQMLLHHSAFVDSAGMTLLAGRNFDAQLDTAPVPSGQPVPAEQQWEERVLINRTALRGLGFATPEEAVGQSVFRRFTNSGDGKTFELPTRVIGVIEDNLYSSLRRRPGPEVYQAMDLMNWTGSPNMLVKYEEAAESSIQERIREATAQLNGQPAQNFLFIESRLDSVFQQEQNESKLLLICGGMALLLACIGLYGLAAFAMKRQVKEVGVRKALGASSPSLVALFLLRFARPVLIANIVAWPVALYFVLQWIERFPYQMERAWLLPLCVGTALAVLLVSLLTVGFITVRAATANPVRSLRYE